MLLLVIPFALGVLFVVEGAVLPVVTLLLLDPATEVAAADKETALMPLHSWCYHHEVVSYYG